MSVIGEAKDSPCAAARSSRSAHDAQHFPEMTSHPNTLCFGRDLPATGAPCVLKIDAQGLTVSFDPDSPDGWVEEIPFAALAVSVGGLDHDQLVLTWTGGRGERALYLKDAELIRSFRRLAPERLHVPFEQAAERARRTRRGRRLVWSLAAGIVLALLAGLWWGSDLLIALAVERIPPEWERKLGESTYRDFLARQEIIKTGPAVSAVEEITRRLVEQIPNNPYQFEVTVVKSDLVNAFALPGGYIVVFTGLMKKAASAEEVAGVLGHELNHVLQRHGLERIVKRLGLVVAASIVFGDQQGLTGLMKQFGVELMTLKFGRAQETEADVTGLHLLYRAKIDPSGMVSFFERLSEKDEGRLEWLSTHPMSRGRAERLKTELASMPKLSPVPFSFEWSAVQAALGGQEAGKDQP
ncbi:MAG: M48 family metallopeptidase [Nitrospira sp.]|nr:M48 family metallopeptidase [Nitrospira sp.]